MKHRPELEFDTTIPEEVSHILEHYRSRRGFNARKYITKKVDLLGEFLAQNNLSGATIGVSGGVDSAVVWGILLQALRTENNPLVNLNVWSLPVTNGGNPVLGVSGQLEALHAVRDTARFLGTIEPRVFNLFRQLKESEKHFLSTDDWTLGQTVPFLRAAALHSLNADAQSEGGSVVIGTTNLDEGGYLGFYGKFSEGAVDVQLISDLHKSEVIAVARELGLPEFLAERTPTGDMHDGTTDVSMFGAPYKAVELLRPVINCEEEAEMVWGLSGRAERVWETWRENLVSLHEANSHKYTVPSPAVHLDILPAGVRGGWNNIPWAVKPPYVGISQEKLVISPIPAEESLPTSTAVVTVPSDLPVGEMLEWFERQPQEFTGSSGRIKDYSPGQRPHSSRASTLDEELALRIWKNISGVVTPIMVTEENNTLFNAKEGLWEPVGVSSYLRFIRYMKNGFLAPHYDEEFIISDDEQTLLSVVTHLTPAESTRLIRDERRTTPVRLRDRSDWTSPAREEDVIWRSEVKAGDISIFPHHILHDGGGIHSDSSRVVIRSDVMFKRSR